MGEALVRARRMLDAAASRNQREQMRTALLQGSNRARGAFSTALDALTALLHDRVRSAAEGGSTRAASGAARALACVEAAKEQATANVNPQLITSELLRQLETNLT